MIYKGVLFLGEMSQLSLFYGRSGQVKIGVREVCLGQGLARTRAGEARLTHIYLSTA